MKKLIITLLALTVFFGGCQKIDYDSTFSIEPQKPQITETILIKFLADSTKLSESHSVEMLVYQYDIDLLSTTEIEMKKEGIGWTAEFIPKPETKGIIVTFKDDEIIENNNSNGFLVYLNDSDGNPLPEAITGHHVALCQWGTWYAELESDNESTSLKFEDTFNKYPEVKTPYLDFYLYTLTRIGTEEAISKLSKELETLNSKTDLSEDEIIVLAKYSNMTDNKDDREKYEYIILEKYPQSKYAAEIANNEMLSANSPEELKTGFIKFLNEYPKSKLAEVSAYRVLRKFVDANDIDGAIKTADEFKELTHPYAFVYSTKKLMAENKDKEALKLAFIGVEAARKNTVSPKSVQPKYLSKPAWEKEREYYFAEVLKITATIQNKLEMKDEALILAEEAQSYLAGDDVELNELYSSLLVELEQYRKAKEVLEQYLSENKGSSVMLDNFETAYTKVNGSNEGYNEYVTKFSEAGKAKLIEKLKSEILDEPAPDFELKDINGNLVKFSDYKGKTVIVDFWATWCGPCIRSFPAMQEANNIFNGDKNVEFLFINSWERVENKLKNAKNFIKEHGYLLTVLMDEKNEAISKFKVTGIPTKFVIGPDQKIKFKSVGFAGTNEELVQELSAMIDLIREK